MNKTTGLISILIILVIGGIVFYTSSIKKTTTPNIEPITQVAVDTTQGEQQKENAVTKEFTLVGGNFSFTPNSIKVNKGDLVRITFKNAEGMHDFVIDEFAVRTNIIKANEEETVQFIADKTGTFEFYCSVGTHREMGMKGTLEVM